ncbi:MAG: hypothetical protein ACYCVY_08470 [Acidiferrobacteraceae bacterium]
MSAEHQVARKIADDGGQYLRLSVGGTEFLLPSGASIAVEPREQLTAETGHRYIVAWRAVLSDRWPVFHLEGDLSTRSERPWAKAVFIDAKPFPVGFTTEDILLLPRDLRVEPFTPLGRLPTTAGPVFSGAVVRGEEVQLLLDPLALAAYLQYLGAQ